MQRWAHRLKLLFQNIKVAFRTETTTRPEARFNKQEREKDFPLHLIETGYSKIRIQDGEASVPDDKTRILDSIAANAADREGAFDRVNRELRAMLAEPALNQSAQKGSLQKAMDVLCADTHRTKVTVDLSYCHELSDLTPLSALEHLQNLNQLTLELLDCPQLSEDSARTQLKGLIDLHPSNAVYF